MTEVAQELPISLRSVVPEEYLQDPDTDFDAVTAAGPQIQRPNGLRIATKEEKDRAKEQFRRGRNPFDVKRQPRDYRGRFREVLARLKLNLGESELNEIVGRVEDAEKQERAGDYGRAADAATDVIQMVDKIKVGTVDGKQLQNIKNVSRELGKAIAYLPMPQGDANAKLRYSDLPPTTQQLLDNMEKRIVDKLTPDKAAKLLDVVRAFTSGQLQLSSDELQTELAKLLRYLLD